MCTRVARPAVRPAQLTRDFFSLFQLLLDVSDRESGLSVLPESGDAAAEMCERVRAVRGPFEHLQVRMRDIGTSHCGSVEWSEDPLRRSMESESQPRLDASRATDGARHINFSRACGTTP